MCISPIWFYLVCICQICILPIFIFPTCMFLFVFSEFDFPFYIFRLVFPELYFPARIYWFSDFVVPTLYCPTCISPFALSRRVSSDIYFRMCICICIFSRLVFSVLNFPSCIFRFVCPDLNFLVFVLICISAPPKCFCFFTGAISSLPFPPQTLNTCFLFGPRVAGRATHVFD